MALFSIRRFASMVCKHANLRSRTRKDRRQSTPCRLKLLRLEERLAPALALWDGGSSGLGTEWDDPVNWAGDQLPGATDDVQVGEAFSGMVLHSAGSVTINSIISKASLNVTGGTFSVAAASAIENDFTLTGGILTGAGTVTVSGLTAWTGGTMAGSGATVATGGLAITTGFGTPRLDGRTLTNAAAAAVRGTDSLEVGGDATINNLAGATFDFQDDVGIHSGVFVRGPATFNNQGTVRKSAGAGTTSLATQDSAITVNNAGTVEVRSGTLRVAADGGGGGTFSVDAGATLEFAGGTQALTGTSSVSGAGTVRFAGGVVALSGRYDVSGATTVAGGTARFAGGATVRGVGTALTISGGTIEFSSGEAVCTTTLVQSGGTLAGSDTVTVSGLTAWTGGTMAGSGRTVALGGLRISGPSGGQTLDRRPLDNAAAAVFDIPRSPYGYLTLANGAVVTNRAGATWEFRDDPGIVAAAGGGAFNNDGILRKAAGSGETGIAVPVNNSGSVDVWQGTLSLQGINSIRFDANTFLTSEPGSTIHLTGSLTGMTSNVDRFAPRGTVVLAGGSSSAPQLLEVMGRDLGPSPEGMRRNFAYGTLKLESAYVRLTDSADNAPGTGAESLYVDALIVPAGSTIDLSFCPVYARIIDVNGTILGGSINRLPDGGPLPLNSSISGNISASGERDEWTFFGHRGQTVTLFANPGDVSSPPPISPKLGYVDAVLLDPHNNVVASGSSSSDGETVRLLGAELPEDGTYRIRVQAPASHFANVGNYYLSLYDATADTIPLVLNQRSVGIFNTPYRTDRWTFAANANEQVRFDWVNASSAIRFRLVGPNSWTGFNDLAADSDLITLPYTGAYVLEAYTTGGGAGSYAMELDQTTLTPLSLGTAYTATLAGAGQAHLFKVDVPQGKVLRIRLNDSSGDDRNQVYVKFAAPPTREDYQFRSKGPAAADQRVLVPSAAAGTWYVLVYSEEVPNPSSYTVLAEAAGMFIDGVTPDHSANVADINLTVTGAGFTSVTTLLLVAPDGVAYAPGTLATDTPTQITATFAAGVIPAGRYTVRLVRPDGVMAELSAAFQVTSKGEATLDTRVILPSELGRHMPATLYVEYANTGQVAMPAPVLTLGGSDRPLLTLDKTRVKGGLWTSAIPDGFSNSVQIYASGATPGILQPGERVQVPVYYVGLQTPWDFSDTTVDFQLDSLTVDDNRPMNWAEPVERFLVQNQTRYTYSYSWKDQYGDWHTVTQTRTIYGLRWVFFGKEEELIHDPRWMGNYQRDWREYSAIEQRSHFADPLNTALRPPGLSDEAWEAVLPNLRAITGETWGDYVKALSRNAAYLGRLGLNVTDVSELWAFQMQQAIGLTPVGSLGTTVDATVELPGADLSFGRYFNPSLVGRQEMGLFGRGWSMAGGWGNRLTIETDETVVITALNGTRRRFQPDLRGGYLPAVGDYAVLTRDGDGFLLTDQSGNTTRYRADGLVEYAEDTHGSRITATYTSGRLTGLSHPAGSLTIEYNDLGRISRVTDAVGRSTQYTYDTSGEHLTSVLGSDGRTTTYAYDTSTDPAKRHALLSIHPPGGPNEFFTYDARGRLATTSNCSCGLPQGATVTYAYDLGEITTIDALAHSTHTYLDHRGRVAKTVDALGRPTYYGYDTYSNLTVITDAAGQQYNFGYDRQGHLIASYNPLGVTTRFEYTGPFGALTKVVDGRGNPMTYEYDTQGDLAGILYADGSRERYHYDAAGDLVTDTNRRGQPISLSYDGAGRLDSRTYPDGTRETFGYDAHGNLVRATDTHGDTIFTYDAEDRLTRIDYPTGKWLEYTYDDAGRRTRLTGSDGYHVNYEYDRLGRLDRLTDASGTMIADYAYDDAGRLTRTDKGNGTYTTYEYDEAGQLLYLINHAADGPVNSRFDYTYDALGRRTSMTILEGRWDYAYDSVGQLTHAVFASNDTNVLPNQDLLYVYDAAGNRVRTVENGVTTEYTTNNLNQYAQVGGGAFTYDADGNLLSDGMRTYAYDAYNHLIRATGPEGVAEYEYDAMGNRIATITNGQRTNYLVDPTGLGNVVVESTPAGTPNASNIFGLGLVARSQTELFYYDFDALGSTVGIAGTGGWQLNHYVFGPFGRTVLSAETIASPFSFLGQAGVMAEGSGRYFARARYYAPALGRFDNPDPIGLAGGDHNLYRYALNDVTNRSDVTGLDSRIKIWFKAPPKNAKDKVTSGDAGYKIGCVLAKNLAKLNNVCGELPGFGPPPPPLPRPGERGPDSEKGPPHTNPDDLNPPKVPNDGNPIRSPSPNSIDPNQKLGPTGFGDRHFVAAGTVLPYRIEFENDPAATAPAQRVTVSDPLDPRLNLDTLRFTEVGFGDLLLTVPAEASRHYRTTVDYIVDRKTMQVEIELGVRPGTRELYAVFQTIDPLTELPPDVLTGFLPPEDGTGRGMGYFAYTLEHSADLPTGTELRNVATIVFDEGERIDTNQVDPHDPAKGTDPAKEALVTIDAVGPTSAVLPLPAMTAEPVFTVSWSGADDPGGSGVRTYDVYVSTDGGVFVIWLAGTTDTSATFLGLGGHGYAFYCVATDNVGHVQPTPAGAQATTTVDAIAPTSAVAALPDFIASTSFAVSWAGSDAISGVAGYTVYVSTDGSPAAVWLPSTTQTSATFTGQDGHAYAFYCVATDHAGNLETEPAAPQATTRVDATPPTSHVLALPAFTPATSFPVGWSGTDQGSGIAGYDVYVSDNDGPYTLWQGHTTQTVAEYTGQLGHTYRFHSIAFDHAGNGESKTTPAEAQTQTPVLQTTLLEAQSTTAPPVLAVSALLGNHFRDPDWNTRRGIAVTQVTGNGSWQYFNGQSWQRVTGVSADNAVLLPAGYRLRFVPAPLWNGTARLLFVAWDGSHGSAGGRASTGSLGDGTPFSTAAGLLAVTVTPAAHAPGWTAAGATLTPVLPGSPSPAGETVQHAFGGFFAAPTAGLPAGVAVTGRTGATAGTWQYQLASGGGFHNFPAVSARAALLLGPNDRIRFVPTSGTFTGAVTLQVHAWDGSGRVGAGGTANLSTAGSTGGTTAFSSAVLTGKLTVNDAPTQSLPAAGITLPATAANAPSKAVSVATLLHAVQATDRNRNPLGMALTGASGVGGWQYRLPTGVWQNVPATLSDASVLLLPGSALVRFNPTVNQSGDATLFWDAWDGTQGIAGQQGVPVAGTGGATAFSSTTAVGTLTVLPGQHRPAWRGGGAALTPVVPTNRNPAGDTVAQVFGSLFQDPGTTVGIAVSGVGGVSYGQWQYSTDDGVTWKSLAGVSASQARLLSATDRIRFVPKAGFVGKTTLMAYAWDGSVGSNGGTAGARGSAFSVTSVTATCLINTAPTLTA